MGLKYTILNNPEVDKKIDGIMNRITREIIFHLNPESIILIGSFGKGEATVILEEGGNLKFLSDFEIVVISRSYLLRSNFKKIERLAADISRKTSLEIDISGITLSLYSLFPPLFRTLKPTIGNYDLKYGSRLIYGKNYLDQIPDFKAENIPLWEGIRLLFNRMSAALKHFPRNNSLTPESIFQTYKVVLACQDVLLLSTGNYHASYAVRNRMLQELFPKHFSELGKKLPRFLSLTIEATECKLEGRISLQDVAKLWFDVAEICNKIFRYVIKKNMGMEFSDYLEFQEKYLRNSELNGRTQARLSSPLYQNIVNLIKMSMSRRGFISYRILKKIWIPWSRMVYSVIPLAYFSFSPDGSINQAYLKRARETLFFFWKLKRQVISETPEFIAEEIYRLIFYCC